MNIRHSKPTARHCVRISRWPDRADMCTTIDNDFQAKLCFVVQMLTTFFLPVINLKQPETSPNETVVR